MSQPTTIDLQVPFDPTGLTEITGAQLEQLVAGASPNSGIGFIVLSVDSAGAPNVPNATVTTKWQSYIWLRVSTNFVTAYVWNPGGATDTTYLNWITISSASIGPGTIQGYQIATNTITDANIANVSSTKITGSVVQSWLAQLNIPQTAYSVDGLINSNSRIFGDLNGANSTVATPVIGPLVVTQSKIALQAVAGSPTAGAGQIKDNSITPIQMLSTGGPPSVALLPAGADPATSIVVPVKTLLGTPSSTNFNPSVSGVNAAPGDVLALTCDASGTVNGYTTIRKAVLTAPEPTTLGQILRVDATGTAYQLYISSLTLQVVQTVSVAVVANSGILANATTTPNYNATGMTPAFNTGAFVKIDTTGVSKLRIKVSCNVVTNSTAFIGLYNATGAVAPLAGVFALGNANPTGSVSSFEYITAVNPTNATYYVAIGCITTGSHAYLNSTDGITNPFLISRSTVTIEEFVP